MPPTKPSIPASHRRQWEARYRETAYRELPWYSPTPYPWVAETAQLGKWIAGSRLLDLGCGAGTNSLFLAKSGFRVSGIDLADGAIEAATARAQRARLTIDFRVGDVLNLPYPDAYFGGAIDIGCFHTLPIRLRKAYAKEVARVLRPRRLLALSWIAREFRPDQGPPHRPSVEEVAGALEDDFLFLRTEYRASYSGRVQRDAPPVYCSWLGRRSFPRPPPR